MRFAPVVTPVALIAAGAAIGGASLSCSDERDVAAAGGSGELVHEAFAVDPDGALALRVGREVARVRTRAVERGGARVHAIERFAPHRDGVEQTWTFIQKPPGEADLIVRVGFDDLTFVGTAACGARYRSESTGNGLCYGRATWVDARGERAAVPWSIDRHGVALRVAADVLEGSTYPAVLDPVIGPEIEVGDFAWGTGNALISGFSAAPGPEGALLVWTTAAPSGLGGAPMAARARLVAPGAQVGAPIELGDAGLLPAPRVGFGGGVFRVFSVSPQGSRMVRLDPTGTILDPGAGVDVDLAHPWADAVACLPDGRCALTLGNTIAVVDADGVVLGEIPAAGELTTTATGWVTLGGPGVTVVALDAATLAPSDPVQLDAAALARAIVARGDTTIVTWCRADGMRWATLDATLQRVHPDGFVPGFCGHAPVSTETGFVAAAVDGRLLEIDPATGPVREATGIPQQPAFGPEAVRIDGTTALWLTGERVDHHWFFLEDPPTAVLGTPVDLATMSVDGTTILTAGPVVQLAPSAASGPAGHVVAFRDFRDDLRLGHDRVRFFDAAGEPLPGPSIRLGSAPGWSTPPAVARQGEHFVAAWIEEDRFLRVRRFAGDGASLDPVAVTVRADREGALAVAATGDAILVASQGASGSFVDVLAGDEVLAAVAAHAIEASAVRFDVSTLDGEVWLVVDEDGGGVTLRRFDTAGAPLGGPTPVDTSGPPWGDDWFGCADRCYLGEAAAGAHVVRELRPDGTTSPILFSSPPGSSAFGSDGARAVVAATDWSTLSPANPVTVEVAWIEEGHLVDHAEGVVTSSGLDGFAQRDWPSIAPLPQGGSLVVYEDHPSARLRARTLIAEPTPIPGGGGGGAGRATSSTTLSASGPGGGGDGGGAQGGGGDGGHGEGGAPSTSPSSAASGDAPSSTSPSAGSTTSGAAAPLDAPSDEGCSCEVPASRPASPAAALLALAAFLARRRRAA